MPLNKYGHVQTVTKKGENPPENANFQNNAMVGIRAVMDLKM